MGAATTTGEASGAFWKQAADVVTKATATLFPYLDIDLTAERERSVRDMNDQWVATWGDPKDPKTEAAIWATVRALEAGMRGS